MPRNDLKAYTSVIARIRQDLADQGKHYAREHRCSVSELIRDGLEMRLEEGNPWHAPGRSREAEREVLHEVSPPPEALVPMLRAQLQDTVRATIREVIQEVLHPEISPHTAASEVLHEVLHEVLPTTAEVVPGHTSTPQAPSAVPNGGTGEVVPGYTEVIPAQPRARTASRGMTEVVPLGTPTAQARSQGMTDVVPFDPVKYRLGKLCPCGHDCQGTGQSLRVNNKAGYCLACNAAMNQRKRDQKRQEVSA